MWEIAEERADAHFEKKGLAEHEYTDEDYNEATKVELPVLVGKIDCVDHGDVCMEYGIRAYPTLKFFVNGAEKGDYRGHRTVVELSHFVTEMETQHKGKDAELKLADAKESECGLFMHFPCLSCLTVSFLRNTWYCMENFLCNSFC